MMSRNALAPLLLATALTAIPALPAWAQSEMSFTDADTEGGGDESLFDRLEPQQDAETGHDGMSFDETSIADHDALACAAGLGCEGLGVNQDDALVLTGHNTADTAREAYQEKYGEPLPDQDTPVDEDAGNSSGSGDETEGDESLFDRLEAGQEDASGDDAMSFDDTSIAEHDALACAAGLGCEGLGVNQDDALVLTGHNTADTAREAYQEKYGEPLPDSTESASDPDLSVDTNDGDISFTDKDVSEDSGNMSFEEDETAEDGTDMSFSEEDVLNNETATSPGNMFTDAEIVAFSQEEDELWACAAAFGCNGAAAGLTPHQALHRLEIPVFSYEWPLAACVANSPGACKEMGISLMDAMRIMSHLANPNR